MSFGAIALSFGVVVLIIMLFAKMNSHPGIPEMTTLGLLSSVAGAALLALGYFVGRMGRRDDSRTVETRR